MTTKKKKPRSLLAPTIKLYEQRGYEIDVVERHIKSLFTKDLFGFGDLLAFRRLRGGRAEIVIVQACAKTDKARRYKKIVSSPLARQWIKLDSICRIHLVAWGDGDPPVGHAFSDIGLADFLKSR